MFSLKAIWPPTTNKPKSFLNDLINGTEWGRMARRLEIGEKDNFVNNKKS